MLFKVSRIKSSSSSSKFPILSFLAEFCPDDILEIGITLFLTENWLKYSS
jgi:hypothetical protein